MGICFSSLFKRSTVATVVSYGVLVFIAAGTYAVNIFMLSMARMNMDSSYASSINGVTDQANSGPCLYLLLLNPVATFYVMINKQAGVNPVISSLNNWFGPHPDNFIMNNWVLLSILIQLLLAAIFILIAIRGVSQSKRRRIRKK
jgi:hypothetical protein